MSNNPINNQNESSARERQRRSQKQLEQIRAARQQEVAAMRDRRPGIGDLNDEFRDVVREVDDGHARAAFFETSIEDETAAAAEAATRVEQTSHGVVEDTGGMFDTSDIVRDAGSIDADPRGLDVADSNLDINTEEL